MKRKEVKRIMNEGIDNSNFEHGRCAVVLSKFEDFDGCRYVTSFSTILYLITNKNRKSRLRGIMMTSDGYNQRYPYSDNRCLKGKWSPFGKSILLDPNSVIAVVDLNNAGQICQHQLLGLTEIIVAFIPTRAITANLYTVGESDAGSGIDSETLSDDENESLGHKKRRRCGSLEDDDEEEDVRLAAMKRRRCGRCAQCGHEAPVATKPLTN